MNEVMKLLIEIIKENHNLMIENARMKAALDYLMDDYIHDRDRGYGHDEVRLALEKIAGIEIPKKEAEEE